jgi:hypothetical protein
MIPVHEGQTLDHSEKTGVVYKLRYLTEIDRIGEYRRIAMAEQAERDSFIPSATEEVKKKKVPDTKREEAIIALAADMLLKKRKSEPESSYKTFDAYIDLFLCGWSGIKTKFPDDGKPSKCFPMMSKMVMFRIIESHLGELIGLTETEIKN